MWDRCDVDLDSNPSQLQQGCTGAIWQAGDNAQQYGDAVSERAGVLCR